MCNWAYGAALDAGKNRWLYLVRDVRSGQEFVLKRTIVKKGLSDVLARAKWEAELYVCRRVVSLRLNRAEPRFCSKKYQSIRIFSRVMA
jgi:hypothetical protein